MSVIGCICDVFYECDLNHQQTWSQGTLRYPEGIPMERWALHL